MRIFRRRRSTSPKKHSNRRIFMLALTVPLIVLLIPVIYLGLQRAFPAKAAWMDSNWRYRQLVRIVNNGSTQTSYQVAVPVDTYSLITAGKMKSDCSDLRFADTNGTSLTYFLEYCASASTKGKSIVWVTVPSITGSATTNIYLYYGNSGASSASTYTPTPTGIDIGSGADGNITISANTNINTIDTINTGTARACSDTTGGDAVIYTTGVNAVNGATSLTLATTPTTGCISAGDEVIIIVLSGANSGKFEFARLNANTSGTTMTLNHPLVNAYNGAAEKVVVQRVPNYVNVTTTTTANFTPSAWNGTSGGLMAFRASGTVTIGSGTTINSSLIGSTGGAGATAGSAGAGGEAGGTAGGTSGTGTTGSGNGAGSGGTSGAGGNGALNGANAAASGNTPGGGGGASGGGGGGAAYGTGPTAAINGGNGGNGGNASSAVTDIGGKGGNTGTRGGNGSTYGSTDFTTSNANLFLGSGGSGGGAGGGGGGGDRFTGNGTGSGGGAGGAGGAGGNGGAIVAIFANSIVNNGQIGANGQNGVNGSAGSAGTAGSGNAAGGGAGGGSGGGGGAGSGGSIWISANTVNVGNSSANGAVANGGVAGKAAGGGAGAGCGTQGLNDGGGGGGGGMSGGVGSNASCRVAGNGANGTIVATSGAGGNGGQGRIFVQYSTNSGGSTSPTPTATQLPIASAPSTEETVTSSSTSEVVNWKFDEGSGTTTADSVSNSATATLAGATPPAWKSSDQCVFGTCLFFDGTSSDLTVANSILVGSISFWVRPVTTASTAFFDFGGGSATIKTNGSSNLTLGGSLVGGTMYLNGTACTTCTLVANRWQHIGVTTTTPITSTSSMTVGLSTQYFKGYMDEVRIYSGTVTAAQIKAEYNSRGSLNGTSAQIGQTPFSTLSDGLVGYWSLDEKASPAVDYSGNGNNATWLNSPTAASGKYGSSISLNGTTQVLDLASDYANLDQAFTISTWIYPTDLSVSNGIFGSTTGNHFWFNVESTGQLTLCNDDGSGSCTTLSSNTGVITTNKWQHVVLTHDGQLHYRFYVNGVDQTNVGTAASATNVGSTSQTIGGNQSGLFAGKIDEFRMYNRALSGTEARALYNWAPDPKAYWKFDENTGQFFYDSSGNNNYGQLGSTTGVDSTDLLWTTGKVGSAVMAESETPNRYGVVPDSNTLDIPASSGLTIGAWVKVTGTSSSNNDSYIVDHINSGTGAGYSLTFTGSTSVCGVYGEFCLHLQDGTNTYTMYTTSTFRDGNWHYVSAVVDRASETNSLIYVDGTPQPVARSGTFSSIGDLTNTDVVCVGMDESGVNCGAGGEFVGSIDEVKIYNYPRTAQQALSDMNGGRVVGGSLSAPVGYWKFDDMNGTSAKDSSGNGQNLTLTNSPAWTTSGKINSGLDFELNSSQYASVSDSQALSLTGDLTLTAWIKPESTTSLGTFPIAGKGGGAFTDYLLVQFEDELRMYIGSSANYVTTSNANLVTGTWYHVSAVYNASAQTVKIYVNGVEQATTTAGTIPSSISDGASPFMVGGFINQTTRAFQISSDADDGIEQANSVWTVSSVATGFGYYASVGDLEAGLRFTNVSIPQGTTITEAHLEVTGDTVNSIGSPTSVNGIIYADKVDNAAAWSSSSRPSQITPTTASVTWNPSSWSSTVISSPSITTIVQEILNRAGWVSGNSLRIAIWNNGVATGQNDVAITEYATSTTKAAKLVVTNTSGSNFYYDGVIDEVQVYNSALSPDQISLVMNANASANYGSGQNESTQITGTAETPPVGYWPLDDNTGTTALDKSGNGQDGTLTNGPLWYPGKVGSAVKFDGTDDYIVSTSTTAITNPTSLSVSVWLNPSVLNVNAVYYPISKGDGGAGGAGHGWSLGVNGTGSFCSGAGVNNVYFYTSNTFACSTSVLPTNTWTHVEATYSGGSTKIYFNGKLESTTSQTLQTDTGSNLNIGRRTDLFWYWNGMIDDLKIYNYARTQAQVAYDYNRGAPIAWWKFDEGSGTTANDASGNGFTGTLTGTPTWASGKFNYGLTLNGSSQYSTVSDSANIRFDTGTQDFSLFAWVKRAATGSEMDIISKEDADNDGYRLEFTSSDTLRCSVNAIDVDSTLTITDTNWHLVGCTISRAGNGQVYIDGKPTGTATAISSTAMATTTGLRIGARSYTVANYLNGTVDDVRLYNYALTQTQINKVYNDGAAVFFGPSTGSP